jgi:hypothetical protein
MCEEGVGCLCVNSLLLHMCVVGVPSPNYMMNYEVKFKVLLKLTLKE